MIINLRPFQSERIFAIRSKKLVGIAPPQTGRRSGDKNMV